MKTITQKKHANSDSLRQLDWFHNSRLRVFNKVAPQTTGPAGKKYKPTAIRSLKRNGTISNRPIQAEIKRQLDPRLQGMSPHQLF